MITLLLSIIVLAVFNILLFYLFDRLNMKVNNENNPVKISVIIAARNEQEKAEKLIDSIKRLDYSEKDFEIIIVDDNSTDNTFEELEKISSGTKNISITRLGSSGLNGKRNALTFGINQSNYPSVVITDADCQPQSKWLKAYSKKFELGYDMLLGIAPFYKRNNLVSRISCFENFRNSLLSFTLASIGMPYTAAARNFGFTKKAFEEIGGYSNTKDTLSGDDDLLLREAVKRKMKIGVVTEADSFVFSETKKTFKEYFQQRARHTQTSFYYLKKHQIILGCWHLMNLLLLFSPLLMFINPLLGIFLPLKLLLDLLITETSQKKFGYSFSVVEIFCLQILYELFLIIHLFNARFSKIQWK